MPEDILDFENLKNKYPFLKEIWKKYTFEEVPNKASDKNNLFPICEDNSMYETAPTDIQKNACKKLLKNWQLLRNTTKRMDEQIDWCNNINSWIYYEINPYILNDVIINRILIKAQEMFRNTSNEYYCSFKALKKEHDPLALNKLRIFNDNYDTFKNILLNKRPNYYCSCVNFIKDCIHIYKTIQNKYCSTVDDKNRNNPVTCEIIKNFNIYYTGYLYRDIGIKEKLPDLSSNTDININIDECPLQTNGKELGSVKGDQLDSSILSTTEQAGKTVPTAIGTIAGVSSVLVLLYKFSPAGTWMNSGLRGNGRIIHSNLYADAERQLLTDQPLIENLNSYNIGYEVAYNTLLIIHKV